MSGDLLLSCLRQAKVGGRLPRLLDMARRDIVRWLSLCSRPVISVSGGKDSTALLQLVRELDSTVPAIRADPPNPLPGRAEHVAALQAAAGGPWHVLAYPWNVDAVLRGEQPYPAGLKVRLLRRAHLDLGHDGVALGIRAAESSIRRKVLRARGTVYQVADGWRCCPLAWWTAVDVLGYLLLTDRLPLNPIYRCTRRMPERSFELLRDGTWWPHTSTYPEVRPWLEIHYPETLPSFDAASRLWLADREEP